MDYGPAKVAALFFACVRSQCIMSDRDHSLPSATATPQRVPTTGRVLLVLGAAVHAGGAPSPTLLRRAEHAARLLRERPEDTAIVSGGIGRHPPSEARVMYELLTAAGISPGRIVRDDRAHTTFDSATFTQEWLATEGARPVVVVTDRYHVPRALLTLRGLGVRAIASTPPEGRGRTTQGRWLYSYLREIPAIAWYLFRVAYFRLTKLFGGASFKFSS